MFRIFIVVIVLMSTKICYSQKITEQEKFGAYKNAATSDLVDLTYYKEQYESNVKHFGENSALAMSYDKVYTLKNKLIKSLKNTPAESYNKDLILKELTSGYEYATPVMVLRLLYFTKYYYPSYASKVVVYISSLCKESRNSNNIRRIEVLKKWESHIFECAIIANGRISWKKMNVIEFANELEGEVKNSENKFCAFTELVNKK